MITYIIICIIRAYCRQKPKTSPARCTSKNTKITINPGPDKQLKQEETEQKLYLLQRDYYHYSEQLERINHLIDLTKNETQLITLKEKQYRIDRKIRETKFKIELLEKELNNGP